MTKDERRKRVVGGENAFICHWVVFVLRRWSFVRRDTEIDQVARDVLHRRDREMAAAHRGIGAVDRRHGRNLRGIGGLACDRFLQHWASRFHSGRCGSETLR